MRLAAFALCALVAAPVSAGVDAALDRHILPGFAAFAAAADRLDLAAQADCRAAAVRPAYAAAFDAWMTVADLRLGPSEAAALSILFWPDDRGFARRTLAQMIAAEDAGALEPATFAEVSVAARGLLALEMLIHDPAFAPYPADGHACALVRAVAADLGRQAAALNAAWAQDFAGTLRHAGSPDNATYLSADEAARAIYTQVMSGLEFTADARLGRPMGSFDRPRPRLAEAWRSGQSLRNAVLAADAAHALATAFADWPLPATDAALARVHTTAARIADPSFQDIGDAQARLRVEVLQQAVRALRAAIETEIGERLGIAPGFNSQDGD